MKKNIKRKLIEIKSKVTFVSILLLLASCQRESSNSNNMSFIYKMDSIEGITEFGMQCDSVKQGLWVDQYPNKKIQSIQFYVDGEMHGPYILFHENGSLLLESKMKNNEFDGKSVVYYDNGNIQRSGYFVNGLQDSIWQFYTYNGDLDKKIRFERGKAIDTLINNELIPPRPPLSPSELK